LNETPRRESLLRDDLALFWTSWVLLFVEILLIRWISAEVRIFSYFHNLVLLFAFLGMGLGLALARRANRPMTVTALLAGLVVLLFLEDRLHVPLLRSTSSLLSRGLGFLIWYPEEGAGFPRFPAFLGGSVLLLVSMAAITAVFIPLGQVLGKRFDEHPRPLRAYGVNLAGSLAGVWLFSLYSWLSLPPAIWFATAGIGCLFLVRKSFRDAALVVLLTAVSVALLVDRRTPELWTIWSPYQKLTVRPATMNVGDQPMQYGHVVSTNSVGYMQIIDYSPEFVRAHPEAFPEDEIPYDHYNVPYRFADSLENVLVVGPGAGNDPSGALRNGARRITAVEIDPGIIRIGKELHPERPYQDPRVVLVNDDARSFFKKTRETYDLIVFGLLDSHTLSSSYANLRLDNYVYTRESFEEARRLLRPNGVVIVTFEVAGSDDYIGARIFRTLTAAFGHEPSGFPVFSNLRGWGGTGFATGNRSVLESRLESDPNLRAMVRAHQAQDRAWAASEVALATDDWPYLYLERPSVPKLHMLVSAVLLLFAFFGVRRVYGADPGSSIRGIDGHFFFLGAGFMLLEVHNISKLSLLFGTTWRVNVVVLSAVLAMILVANLFAGRSRGVSRRAAYAALFVGLTANFLVPLDLFSPLSSPVKELVVAAFAGFPIFCAGVVFSTSFASEKNRSAALAVNLLGAMLGGVLESLSFLLGIRPLLVVAAALYGGSLVFKERNPAAAPLPRAAEV